MSIKIVIIKKCKQRRLVDLAVNQVDGSIIISRTLIYVNI